MYSPSEGRFGSDWMPLRLSVLTWYWSMTQGAAVAQPVVERFGRDAGQGERGVDGDAGFVFVLSRILPSTR